MKFINRYSLEDIKTMAAWNDRLVYAAQTCWWKIGDPVYRMHGKADGLPCGPRGEVLLEMDKPNTFIVAAERNPEHYGKHGILAFVAAYHGNVTTDAGLPISFDSWDKYNEVLDEFFKPKGKKRKILERKTD